MRDADSFWKDSVVVNYLCFFLSFMTDILQSQDAHVDHELAAIKRQRSLTAPKPTFTATISRVDTRDVRTKAPAVFVSKEVISEYEEYEDRTLASMNGIAI